MGEFGRGASLPLRSLVFRQRILSEPLSQVVDVPGNCRTEFDNGRLELFARRTELFAARVRFDHFSGKYADLVFHASLMIHWRTSYYAR